MTCLAVHMAGFLADLEEAYGVSRVRTEVETQPRFAGRLGRVIPVESFMRTRFRILELGAELAGFHETYDVVITSPLGRAPPSVEDAEPSTSDARFAGLLASRLGNQLLRAARSLDA